MAGCTNCLITVSIVGGIFAYLIYVPLPPEDFSNPWTFRIELALTQLIDNIAWFAETIGYGYSKMARDVSAVMLPLLPAIADTSIHCHDTAFDGVTVRIYQPVKKESKPFRAVVYFHGGGFVIGDLDMYHRPVYRIAQELDAVVVSVKYRTGPESVFPTAVNDCETATKFFLQHLSDYDVDPNRVALMGDSAGGNLATTISRRLSAAKFNPLPKLQVLLYPSTQMINNDLPSYQHNQYGPVATKHQDSYFTSWYVLGNLKYRNIILNNSHVSLEYRNSIKHIMDLDLLPDDKIKQKYRPKPYHDSGIWDEVKERFQSPDLCPLLADEKELKLMPPVYIITCQYDILRDEEFFYIERLKKTGVKVIHDHMHACVHGWTFFHETTFNKEYSDMIAKIDQNL